MSVYSITTVWCDSKGCSANVDIPGNHSPADARLAAGREHGWSWEGPTDAHPHGVDLCRNCTTTELYRHRHTTAGDCPIYGCTWPTPVELVAVPWQYLTIIWQGGEFVAPLGSPVPAAGQAPGPAWLYRGVTKP